MDANVTSAAPSILEMHATAIRVILMSASAL